MNNIYRYACAELDELDRKAEKNGGLTLQDFQYADMLAHLKKTEKINQQMEEAEKDGYSNRAMYPDYRGYWEGSYADGMGGTSMARGGNMRRDPIGRFSGNDMPTSGMYSGHPDRQETMKHLRMAMESTDNERTRQEIERVMSGMNG